MCGIWSFISKGDGFTSNEVKSIVKELFIQSETRGKEASGIAGLNHSGIYLYKAAIPGSELIKSREFEQYWEKIEKKNSSDYILLGHSRLTTNGSEGRRDNNQPVFGESIVTVHNGIIVNVDSLWNEHADIEREHEVDSEIFVKLFEKFWATGSSVDEALRKTYSEISGMASTISLLSSGNILVAATNNGSLYYCRSKENKSILIASERLILSKVIKNCHLSEKFDRNQIRQIRAGRALYVKLSGMRILNSEISEETNIFGKFEKNIIECEYGEIKKIKRKFYDVNILDENKLLKYDIDIEPIKKLRRCVKCVLPETMPFIEFDDMGICNYCRTYKPQQYKGKEELSRWVKSLSVNKYGLDSLVSFSGGRDSSYGLHYFVKELGLKPVAYAYDWGMVTDLARRNQSRMCAQLGIELVIVSADIRKKRENIKKNVEAWLKKPDIGMIPLFMAGDKHYFYYANKVRRDFGIGPVLLASNPFEKTYFKSGYCGVKPEILRIGEEKRTMERLPAGGITRMASHYGLQYMMNPAYINTSIWDTVKAALSYYVIPHNYFLLYDYIPWNEKEVDKVLINQYDWETAADTESTWRIGDGTAPFYNYIYYSVTGFSENDTLRSNQIREGMLTRDEALELIYRDNQPRFDSIKWYFDTIGSSMYDALDSVSKMKKYYG